MGVLLGVIKMGQLSDGLFMGIFGALLMMACLGVVLLLFVFTDTWYPSTSAILPVMLGYVGSLGFIVGFFTGLFES